MNEFARFFAVTVLGVVVDIGVAFALAQLLGMPLWLSITLGFTVAALQNYALHQIWTFQNGLQQLSMARGIKYVGAAITTLLVRIVTASLLASLLQEGLELVILICATGVSFVVNFAISKTFVFAEAPLEQNAP